MKVRANGKWSSPWTRLAVGLTLACVCLPTGTSCAQEPLPQPARPSDLVPTAPDPERVFRLESEATLMQRMAAEALEGKNPLDLRYAFVPPPYPPVPPPVYPARTWEPLLEIVEPAYVCYGRLYFEQINSERYGWDLGPLHPLISAGIFYFDVATLPYHAATDPLRRHECNTGYCLPGDRVPLLLYKPDLNVPGILGEAAAVGLLFVIFP